MRKNTFKATSVAIALSLGVLGATLPPAADAASQAPQCNAVTGCGTLLDYIKNLFLKP
jgi:hypothetical protein